jgi:hypothetical protein
MDRNEMARAQQRAVSQVRAQFAAFAQDFAAGKAVVLDRFASHVQAHDLVLWQPPHVMVYEVTKVEPILEVIPNQPIGMIKLTLEMMAPVNFLAGTPAMSMIVVGHQIDATNAELNGASGGRRDNEPEAPSGPTYTADEETSARQNIDAERERLRAERAARDTPPPGGGGTDDGDTGN